MSITQTGDITQLAVLKQWIRDNGKVDYPRIKNDPWFAEQIRKIENINLEGLSYQEEFAFWLNAYITIPVKNEKRIDQ